MIIRVEKRCDQGNRNWTLKDEDDNITLYWGSENKCAKDTLRMGLKSWTIGYDLIRKIVREYSTEGMQELKG